MIPHCEVSWVCYWKSDVVWAMFRRELNMGLPDYAVSRAIPELRGDEQPITYQQIAVHIGCSRATVERAMRNLMDAGHVVRLDDSKFRGPSRYRVTK